PMVLSHGPDLSAPERTAAFVWQPYMRRACDVLVFHSSPAAGRGRILPLARRSLCRFVGRSVTPRPQGLPCHSIEETGRMLVGKLSCRYDHGLSVAPNRVPQ